MRGPAWKLHALLPQAPLLLLFPCLLQPAAAQQLRYARWPTSGRGPWVPAAPIDRGAAAAAILCRVAAAAAAAAASPVGAAPAALLKAGAACWGSRSSTSGGRRCCRLLLALQPRVPQHLACGGALFLVVAQHG